MDKNLLLTILVPLFSGVVMFFVPEKLRRAKETLVLLATSIGLILSILLFKYSFVYKIPWVGPGLDLSLRLYHFSAFMLLATAAFAFLIALYSSVFMRGRNFLNQFYAYFLLSVAFTNGAFLADNLLLLLFFWEGLLALLFGMIAIGNKGAFKTATKAFIIVGITDLCMMLGIALTGHLAGTLSISQINLPLTGLANLAFILLMIGAISKAGAMPFHSWIPDAAIDAPLPFMSLIPAALEKLLGIYFLARISLDLFQFTAKSGVSLLLMIIGGITIILAVMMALIQKDYKRLLSYHAVSQVGYMILGIGTALPAGIVGGLFHMINNALYKSCLFLTAGAVEKQAGTTSLEKLGGLAKKMPVTFICFIITACAISGVWPFNGFFSKELVYDGALQRGLIFYIIAVAGSFFTAASFLKLGHAAFLGKTNSQNEVVVREVHFNMLIPMLVMAVICIIFGVFNWLPLSKLIQPILSPERLEGHNFSVFHANLKLVLITFVVLFLAIVNHFYGVAIKKSGLHALDHIRFAPGISRIYDLAERGVFDPYNLGFKLVNLIARLSFILDRGINWAYDVLAVRLSFSISDQLKKFHSGNYSVYLSWSLLGLAAIIVILVMKAY